MEIMWTIAYRKRTGNVFHRVTNWCGTWAEARDMAGALLAIRPDLQVWYTTTAAWEASEAINLLARVAAGEMTQDLADSYLEDHGNILVDSGKRIKIRDNGTLPAELLPVEPPRVLATAYLTNGEWEIDWAPVTAPRVTVRINRPPMAEMSHGDRTAIMWRAAQRRHSTPNN